MRAGVGSLPRGRAIVGCGGIVGLAGLLVACSGDPQQPGTLPDRSPTTVATAPTSTPSTPEAEVEAAVRTYYDQLTRAAQANQPQLVEPLVAPGCPCYNAVKVIKRNVREGETTPDARFTVESVSVHDVEARTAGAEVTYQVSAYDVLRSDGSVATSIEAQQSHLDLSLVKSGQGRWIIANVVDLEA